MKKATRKRASNPVYVSPREKSEQLIDTLYDRLCIQTNQGHIGKLHANDSCKRHKRKTKHAKQSALQ